MKIQDIIFILILGFIVIFRRPRLGIFVGLISLLLSVPLFALHVFFTAERLTWYAAGFFVVSVIQMIINGLKTKD